MLLISMTLLGSLASSSDCLLKGNLFFIDILLCAVVPIDRLTLRELSFVNIMTFSAYDDVAE